MAEMTRFTRLCLLADQIQSSWPTVAAALRQAAADAEALQRAEREIERLRAEKDNAEERLAAWEVDDDETERLIAPYLKDGETVPELVERERKDCDAVIELLRQEKVKTERAEQEKAALQSALDDRCNVAEELDADLETAEARIVALEQALIDVFTLLPPERVRLIRPPAMQAIRVASDAQQERSAREEGK